MSISFPVNDYNYSYDSSLKKDSSQTGAAESPRAFSESLSPDSALPAIAREGAADLPIPENQNSDQKKRFDSYECQTCKNRKYQDGSDDPGVSYKSPTKLDPQKAASSVRAHENEHVVREQAKARRTGRKVVSQSVTYHSSICPECGKVYTSGGTTRTVTKSQVDRTYGLSGDKEENGKHINMAV